MGSVKVVTDSASDLPHDLANQWGVSVVPLYTQVGNETVVDGPELDREEFGRRVAVSPVRLATSQPSPGLFLEVYRRLAEDGSTVVSVHVSGRLSGTFQAANVARGMLPQADIEVVDSGTGSMALGLAVLEGARAAARGEGKEAVVTRIRRALQQTWAFFAVGSLTHLHKIGRLGRLQALLGSLLEVHPVLYLENDEIGLYDRIRGERAMVPRLVEIARSFIPPGLPLRCAVVHIRARHLADQLCQEMKRVYQCVEMIMTHASAVISAALGPNSLGLFFSPPLEG
ncbi:MAG: DegV family protein [Acetobacteraceae bacterium]|nr:DegV family protein [Acetobacteraceae bacterium]